MKVYRTQLWRITIKRHAVKCGNCLNTVLARDIMAYLYANKYRIHKIFEEPFLVDIWNDIRMCLHDSLPSVIYKSYSVRRQPTTHSPHSTSKHNGILQCLCLCVCVCVCSADNCTRPSRLSIGNLNINTCLHKRNKLSFHPRPLNYFNGQLCNRHIGSQCSVRCVLALN